MPRHKEAALSAADLGITLPEADWHGTPSYPYQKDALAKYKAFEGVEYTRAVLRDLEERPLSTIEAQRAWAALRLDEVTEAFPIAEESRARLKERRRSSAVRLWPGDEKIPRTRVTLVSQMERMDAMTKTCIFISSIGDSFADREGDNDAVEKWTLVREVTIGIVQEQRETEVVVAIGETVLATMCYEEGSHRLLRCGGRVGLALELFTVVAGNSREISYDSRTYSWVKEFETVRDILAWSTGVAAVTEFKAASTGAKIKPSGSGRWMPTEISKAVFALLPVRQGFVDLRDGGMQAAVRPVSYKHGPLLCPMCWDTGNPNRHRQADFFQPRRLIGSEAADRGEQYTAVSHLWSEFKGEDTVANMRHSAASVGGASSLWIDKLCIDQDDTAEKAVELSHMGSYYAGAQTTLICPAQQVSTVPLVERSRHLVAIPEKLNEYRGLAIWRQDPWHSRVWTFQEGYLSRNPQVLNSDTGTGLNACWLDFVAYAATESSPLRCEVGLPPYHQLKGWGGKTYGGSGGYITPFMRAWASCEKHNWAPDLPLIQIPLGRLLRLTHRRKCTVEHDHIVGVLGLATGAEKFRPGGLRNLDDAYREAVRCGALGAEVLLADLGGNSPNSCWIPKSGSEARHEPAMDSKCNALGPMVDESGGLVCEAYEVDMDMDAREACKEWGSNHSFNLLFNGGVSDAQVQFHGCTSPHGRVYMLVPHEEKESMAGRVLIWASDNGDGTHHLHGTGSVTWGHQYRTGKEARVDREKKSVTLTLGSAS
jgi:hypothetical protein